MGLNSPSLTAGRGRRRETKSQGRNNKKRVIKAGQTLTRNYPSSEKKKVPGVKKKTVG